MFDVEEEEIDIDSDDIVIKKKSVDALTEGINMQSKLNCAFFIIIFQLGFLIFEWGAARKKNADFVILKYVFVLAVSIMCVFCTGFALAYGNEYKIIGDQYFFSANLLTDLD